MIDAIFLIYLHNDFLNEKQVNSDSTPFSVKKIENFQSGEEKTDSKSNKEAKITDEPGSEIVLLPSNNNEDEDDNEEDHEGNNENDDDSNDNNVANYAGGSGSGGSQD